MSIIVDTNVISDLVYGASDWKNWSLSQLVEHAGQLCVNPMIYAELCVHAVSRAEVEQLLLKLDLKYEELPRHSLFLAARAFRTYRERGGTKTSPLPDFFIGAHAEVTGRPILTRDATRYRAYFPTVPLICPK